MKRFHFRLQRVLEVREFELERRRLEYREVLAAHLAARNDLEAARRRALRGAEALREQSAAGVSAGLLLVTGGGIARLYAAVQLAQQTESRAAAAADRVRSKLVEARTRVRALETLRERALEEHRCELQRNEQMELDELAGRMLRVAAVGRRP